MDRKKNKENVPKVSPVEEGDETEEKTPTNEEMEFLDSNPSPKKPYRICISPWDNSETSSGSETTPDAALLNNSPFEVKVLPKLLNKRKASSNTPVSDSSDDHKIKTPEKFERPINFKNLSPRSVAYEFSTKYPSGVLRPTKISRSFNSLLDSNLSEPSCSKSLEHWRTKSDEPIGIAEKDGCESPPRKKKHVRSVSFSERVDVIRETMRYRDHAIEADKIAASIELMNVSPETDDSNGSIQSTETAATNAISLTEIAQSYTYDNTIQSPSIQLAAAVEVMNVSPVNDINEKIQSKETEATNVISPTENTPSYTYDSAHQCASSQR